MQTITFTCETITPMFLSGADGSTPELRPPSIKGALRFWWRAMNGHLVELKKDKNGQDYWDYSKLKEQEASIFGGTEPAQRSRVIVRVEKHIETESKLQTFRYKPTPREGKNFIKPAFKEKQRFNILLWTTDENTISTESLKSLFVLACVLGGWGGRKNRGFGSIHITNHQIPETIDDLLTFLYKVTDKQYFIKTKDDKNRDCISSNFGKDSMYPYIKQIQIGTQQNNLLNDVAITQHKLSERDFKSRKNEYGASLGDANFMRFSSPIRVSGLIKNKQLHSIIVTLNTVPEKNKDKINETLQKEFKNQIL